MLTCVGNDGAVCVQEGAREREREKGGAKQKEGEKASLPGFWKGVNLLVAGLPVVYDEY